MRLWRSETASARARRWGSRTPGAKGAACAGIAADSGAPEACELNELDELDDDDDDDDDDDEDEDKGLSAGAAAAAAAAAALPGMPLNGTLRLFWPLPPLGRFMRLEPGWRAAMPRGGAQNLLLLLRRGSRNCVLANSCEPWGVRWSS